MKALTRFHVILIMMFTAMLCGCIVSKVRNNSLVIPGNGRPVADIRKVGKFSAIKAASDFNIEYNTAATSFLKVETDSNVQHYIDTKVVNDTLMIRWTDSGRYVQRLRKLNIYVYAPQLQLVDLTGAVKFTYNTEGNKTTRLGINADKSSWVTIRGDADTLLLDLNNNSRATLQGHFSYANLHLKKSSVVDRSAALLVNSSIQKDNTSRIVGPQ
jgi:hypothetical protein